MAWYLLKHTDNFTFYLIPYATTSTQLTVAELRTHCGTEIQTVSTSAPAGQISLFHL